MANTIRASKSTFSGGLVMDLAPDTTPNTVLTSALNATLVTFNGNEMQLQNDMGNGRVETARLPEGYIPVGTCEFGDIIYIVSYNPLTNKSQIGCFPSPERNISSEEVGSAGQTLSSADFQELELNELGEPKLDSSNKPIPTGKLKTNSVKKIIYNNKLNPGDKFIIYDKSRKIYGESHISDMGNISHVYGSFPKWLKIHVVAIEDSGKINYLDSTLRWYDNYFIAQSKKDNQDILDIDSYRNLLSSGYSVFQSKISGKLALLVELEKITGFSCTHTIYSKKGNSNKVIFTKDENNKIITEIADIKEDDTNISYIAETNNYLTYINFSWETEDPNINPAAVILTDAEWVGEYEQQGKVKFWEKNNKLIELIENGTDYYKSVSYKLPDTQTEESTEASTEESTKQEKLIEEKKLITITTSIPSYPNDKYYEVSLDTLNYGNYESFEKGSYNVILVNKLKNINTGTGYSEDALTKLNIVKTNEEVDNLNKYLMLPKEGYYYINALEKIKENNGQINFYSKSSSTGKLFKISPQRIEDYIVNNYFHYPIYKRFLEFTIPTNEKILVQESKKDNDGNITEEAIYIDKKPDITNMVYKYTVTPAMPYGLLDEYSITNYIDFSKIGTGSIELNTWKYFVGENSLTLTLGLEAYIEDNMGISEIAIEFIDNQGVAAIYHITGKASYSGQFTEVIPLNGATSKNNLNSLNNYRGTTWNYTNGICVHCGQQLTEYQEGCVTFKNNKPVIATLENTVTETGEPTYYLNDAGIIYFGMLYLAKITVKYCPKDALDNLDDSDSTRFKTFNRWLWTTTMFNDQYYQVKDFNDLQLTLTYDIGAKYESNKDYYYKKIDYISPETSVTKNSDDISKYISAQVQIITDSKVNNITEDSDNTGDNTGDNQGNTSEEMPVLWTNWTIESSSDTITLTMSCTVNAKWDTSLLRLTLADGTKTYEQGKNYKVTIGDANVLIELVDIPNQTELLLISERGFGKANEGKDQSPYRELKFKYELNG